MKEKEIRNLIKIVEETGINEIEVTKWWGKKVKIVKAGGTRQIVHSDNSYNPPVATPSAIEKPSEQAAVQDEAQSKYYVAKSPMVGTFYRAPAPGEAPFVSVGDTVKQGQTLCIIEAMKVMNEIESEITGTVVEILIENAEAVEFNKPLFHIDEGKV